MSRAASTQGRSRIHGIRVDVGAQLRPHIGVHHEVDARTRLPEAEYRARLSEVDARIRARTSPSEPTLDDAADLFGDLPALWAEAEPDERRRLVAPLIERVYLDLDSRQVGAFTPLPAFRSLLRATRHNAESRAVILTGDAAMSPLMLAWWRRGSAQLPHPYRLS